MTKLRLCAVTVSIVLAALAAMPAAAMGPGEVHSIRHGMDYWRTPAGGGTFTFPPGDVEALCHKPPDASWTHGVSFEGVPVKGADWDSAVARLADAHFDHEGVAYTRIQFKYLHLRSTAPSSTPCGNLSWHVRLAGHQPITKMKITRTSPKGGTFFADLALRAELVATDPAGKEVGKLFYDIKLPDPTNGTPWSYEKRFRGGMDTANNCLKVERQELANTPTTSFHYYFISDAIAQGKCVFPDN